MAVRKRQGRQNGSHSRSPGNRQRETAVGVSRCRFTLLISIHVSTSWSQLRLLSLGYLASERLQGRDSVGVDLNEPHPWGGNTRVVEDRLDRAFRHARLAIDAVFQVDVELRL